VIAQRANELISKIRDTPGEPDFSSLEHELTVMEEEVLALLKTEAGDELIKRIDLEVENELKTYRKTSLSNPEAIYLEAAF
jgi:hypothetical protein